MTKYLRSLLLLLYFLLVPAAICLSADVTLSWDPSPSPDVQGYYVYYKLNDPTLPFDGTGANEGSSPIDANSNLTATLTGLSDSGTYYFTITAYDTEGNESTFSNIVSSSSAVPALLSPAQNATNEPIPVTFQWATTSGMTYKLHYGTDQALSFVAAPLSIEPKSILPSPPNTTVVIFFALFLTMALGIPLINRNRTGYAVASLVTCLLLASCGGGGGGGDGSSTTARTTTTTPSNEGEVYTVDVGATDYYQAFDLKPGTTYYWKVVGTDANNPSQSYQSPTHQFTTENL